MTAGFVIPFRGLRLGKSRLRAHMPAATVDMLSERMLTNVLSAVRGAAAAGPTVLITRSRAGLSATRGVTVLEAQLDHNDAVEYARAYLSERGVERIVVVASDLPLVQAVDIDALLKPSADVVIAADGHGRGTNALAFPANQARFSQFGAASANRHEAEAEQRKLSLAHVQNHALALDVDTIDQIDDAVRAACAPGRSRD